MTYIVEMIDLSGIENPMKAMKMAHPLSSEKICNEINDVSFKALKAPLGGPPSLSSAAAGPGPGGARQNEDRRTGLANAHLAIPHERDFLGLTL